ncbi:hypothetical protein Tco_0604575, partial [Tanacetum coccineum]
MIDHTQAEAMGKLSNVLCQVEVTTIIAKFLILDIPIDCDAPIVVGQGFLHTMGSLINTSERIFLTFDGVCHQTFRAARFDVLRTAESDSDDEEEYVIKRNKFGAPIYGLRPAPYLNCANLEDRSLAIQAVLPDSFVTRYFTYCLITHSLTAEAPHPSEYVPDPMELEDHVPVYIPEPEHPEDLVPAEDEAPIEPYITERSDTAPSIYHLLLPAGTPPLLPIPLPAPSTSRRADIPEANTPPRKRLLLTAPTPRVEVGEGSAAAARQLGSTMARRVDHSFVDTVDTWEAQEHRAAVGAEIEILRRERLAYEQESIETRQALARSEAYSRALEA